MVVFNYLVPALFLNLTVQNTIQIGEDNLSTGGTLVLGAITTGTLISEPGFETQINASISYANDWPTGDPDGLHDRPNLRGLVTTDNNEYLQIAATGIQTPIPELGAIITGEGSGSLPFGAFQSGEHASTYVDNARLILVSAVFVVRFRTGAKKYKNLEDSIFVASETVKSLGGGVFRAGLKISKLYSTKTNVTLD